MSDSAPLHDIRLLINIHKFF